MNMSVERRRDFGIWMRTGQWPLRGDFRKRELKFNRWHDPKDGQFTFSGAGRYYGPGSSRRSDGPNQAAPKIEYVNDSRLRSISTREEVEVWRTKELAERGHLPEYRRAIEEQYRRYLHQLAHPARNHTTNAGLSDRPTPSPPGRDSSPRREAGFSGGGGGFGGGGASGEWSAPSPQEVRDDRLSSEGRFRGRQGPTSFGDPWRHVARNGYLYEIDEQNRTRRVSGDISLNSAQGRSRSVQRAAGGPDRRAGDQGGHYIARRFNGPTEAFNHFAQDGNFNRSDYAKLEEEWAKAKRLGKNVRVKIVPVYEGSSQRPSVLNVWFWIDGVRKSARLPNESQGGNSDRR